MRKSTFKFEKDESGAPVPERPLSKEQMLAAKLGRVVTLKKPAKTSERFEGIEHYGIGNIAFSEFIKANPKFVTALGNSLRPIDTKLNLRGKWLQAGAFVSLGGDFYGVAEKPISFAGDDNEQQMRFAAAYETLAKADPKEVEELLQQMKVEAEAVVMAAKNGEKPSIGLHRVSGSNNVKYTQITKQNNFPGGFFDSRYIQLAQMNFDHFKGEALIAFNAGFKKALATAKEAWFEKEPVKKEALLVEAISQVLFACHFLTDLFSAGHLRTPRKEMWDIITNQGIFAGSPVAGLLAMKMHGEDNAYGLYVTSDACPGGWRAYGDHCYFDAKDDEGDKWAVEAVKASLADVFKCALGQEPTYDFHHFLPKPSSNNFSPMFKVEVIDGKNRITIRADINDRNCTKRDVVENPKLTLLAIQTKYKEAKGDEKLSDDDQAELKELGIELDDALNAPDSVYQCSPN